MSFDRPIEASVAQFGAMPDGTPVYAHTLANTHGMEVRFIDLGGIITSIRVPDRSGHLDDVSPGYDSLSEYLADRNYFGALIGRFANRIADAHFVVDGAAYQLEPNEGLNLLHGGQTGFHRVAWTVNRFESASGMGAVLRHASPEGAAGFPGRLDVSVTYMVTPANELVIEYLAVTDAATPINLTQHLYVNLAGHGAGKILDHELQIAGSHYLPIDEELIPTGQIVSVAGTAFDFRRPRLIGDALATADADHRVRGYDHTFMLDDGERVVARLAEPVSGRTLEIETTEPGLQFYSGNQLPEGMRGKAGARYGKHAALALETQHYPNSPNVPAFPSTILRPGEVYESRTVYRFGVMR